MKTLLLTILALPLAFAPDSALAAENDKTQIPAGALYRYETDNGQTVVSSTLPREAIEAGYEILDRQGRVVREVEPAPSEEDLQQMREQQQEELEKKRQAREDKRLLRLYAGPEDAIRARDRQLEALKLNIEYSNNNIQQVKEKLSNEISAAARYERQGKEVPEGIRETIDRYQQQIEDLNAEIEQYEQDMAKIREKFQPIIQRLRQLTGTEPGGPSSSSSAFTEDQAIE